MHPEKAEQVKNYVKSNAANYLVLRNTNQTLSMIKQAQRQN